MCESDSQSRAADGSLQEDEKEEEEEEEEDGAVFTNDYKIDQNRFHHDKSKNFRIYTKLPSYPKMNTRYNMFLLQQDHKDWKEDQNVRKNAKRNPIYVDGQRVERR